MRLCRVRFMIVLRPRAIRHKFRLGTGFMAGRLLGVPYGIAVRRWKRTQSRLFTEFKSGRRARPYESDAAVPQQTQIDNDASGSPQRVAGRPLLLSVGGIVLHQMGQKGSGTAPTVSHTGDELIFTANCKRKMRLSWWAASFAVCHLRHWLRGLQNMAKGD